MITKENVLYSPTHEWVFRKEDNKVLIGISSYAAMHLGDLVFLELKEVGTKLSKDESFAEIESVKQVDDLLAPISGTITKINNEVVDDLTKITNFPFDSWIVEIEVDNEDDLSTLLDVEAYENQLD